MRKSPYGLIWVFLAPLFYSAMSCSAKMGSAHLSVWQIGVGRFALGLVLVPVIVRFLKLNLWGRQRPLLVVRGLCGMAGFLLLVTAFKTIPLSVAMVLFYLYPAFTVILSPWVTKEPTNKGVWPFVIGAFAGTALILWPGDHAGTTLEIGHLLAVIASVLCALTLLLVRRLARDNNIYTLFFYLCLTGTLAGIGPLLTQDAPILPGTSTLWLELAAVAVFSVGAQLSINKALTYIPAPKVSVMMTAEVPLVACFGVVFLGEPFGWRLMLGALLIFGCGIALSALPARSLGT